MNTPSVRKYLSSKWIKGGVSRRILVQDTSLFIHFDDKYFGTEGVLLSVAFSLCGKYSLDEYRIGTSEH